jgi:hypothetical protein
MSDSNKAVSLEVADNKLVIKVDPNKDGEAVMLVSLDLAEVPDEVLDIISKAKKDK